MSAKDLSVDLTNIRNLGRKARARLEEERSKRPEIVRVDLLPPGLGEASSEPKRPANPRPSASKRKSEGKSANVSLKRKRPHQSESSSKIDDKDIDRWMPDTSHLWTKVNPGEKAARSRVVQIHGLPIKTVPTQIRGFFSGLDVERVIVLANCQYRIEELDARYDNLRKLGGPQVERYKNSVRVCVEMKNIPAAELALQRSGEVMPLARSENEGGARGASIRVTMIPKPLVTYLLKHLAIDVERDMAIEDCHSAIEKNLDFTVPRILWTAARKILSLADELPPPLNSTFPLYINIGDPRQKADYKRVAKHHNSLREEYNRLRYMLPFPSADRLDPTMSKDPVLGLTSNAADCILQEMARLNQILLQARRWSHLCPLE